MKKKIAYVVTPVEFGGAERVSLNFLKNVDRNKFQIYPIIFFRPWEADGIFLNELKEENYPVHKIPVSVRASLKERDRFWLVRCFRRIFLTLLKFLSGATFTDCGKLKAFLISTTEGFMKRGG